jgi:uncharacterized membrane protein YqhA
MSGVREQDGAGGPEAPADGDGRRRALARGTERRFEASLSAARLLFVIPVVFLLLDAAAAFVYGASVFIGVAHDFMSGVPTGRNHIDDVLGRFLLVMDTYLVGATLMIGAFGFYELFIVRGATARRMLWLPAWLQMRDLDDLKGRVVSMLILVAGTTFVDFAVETTNEQSVLLMGLGIAAVIVALTLFYWLARRAQSAESVPSEPTATASRSGQADGPLDD